MDKRKLNFVKQVLREVSVAFLDTKDSVEKHLEQKCLNENISVKEVIYFFIDKLRIKELAQQTCFYCIVSGFKAGTGLLLESYLFRNFDEYNVKLRSLLAESTRP